MSSCRTSDAVSLHLPAQPGSPPLLGAREIARIKPGAVLVNLARASLVDIDAVVAALESGALGGAAFDVWTEEPPAADDARLRTRGLLVTPHVGWSSPEADEAWRAEAIDALRARWPGPRAGDASAVLRTTLPEQWGSLPRPLARRAPPRRAGRRRARPHRGGPRPPPRRRERETSIRRGVEVMLSLATDEALAGSGLGVTRISELLGREKSQVSRALKALSEYGLVERDKDAGYRLGWRLYALAQLAGERRLLEAAGPMMRRLAHSLGERVHLSVLQGAEALTVLSESPGRRSQTTGWAGRVTPAYCTSAGRALLLDWDDDEIIAVFAKVELVSLTPKTVRTPRKLAAAVAAAREAGTWSSTGSSSRT